MLISFNTLKAEFFRVLTGLGFTDHKAETLASVFAENSRDGVYSHGLNRFPTFVEYVREGLIHIDAEPVSVDQNGSLERWDGNFGPGILNARICMDRATQLAKENGIGCVALRNTNHWMRGGTYGWLAAEAGCISISFTNTIANVPPWGGIDPRLGNNPLVISIPRKEGHIVLDMAMSQYSYGKLHDYKNKGNKLPFDGGFDTNGNLTKTPEDIISSQRALPIGFWKGSGLSLVLDILVTLLSNGRSTAKVTESSKESGVSQVFICIYQPDETTAETLIKHILDYTKTSRIQREHGTISYPGENMLKTRIENLKKGIPVDETIWTQIKSM